MPKNTKFYTGSVIAIVFIVAVLVRFLRLEINGLNGDEMLQIYLSQVPDLSEGLYKYIKAMARECLGQAQPLLTYALARWSTDLLGYNLLGFRLPSLIAGTAFPVIVAAFFSKRVHPFFGLFTALIPATYYWHAGVSLQARPYAMASLLGLVSYLIWSLPINDPWRKKIPRGFYALLSALGILTNLFYFVTFAALSLLDVARAFFDRKDLAAKRAYLTRFFEFWIPGTLLLPYLLLLVRRQVIGGWKEPSKGLLSEAQKAVDAVSGGIEIIPRIFSTAIQLPSALFFFFGVSGLAIATLCRSQRKHYFLLLFSTVWVALALGCAFSYGSMTWWGENYITLLRVLIFTVSILTLGKIWIDHKETVRAFVILILISGLGLTSIDLIKNWKNPYYEDWISATKFIQTLPPTSELTFNPAWLYSLNYQIVGKLLKINPRKDKEIQNPNKICTVYFAAQPKPSSSDFIYNQAGVAIACAQAGK